MSNNTNEPEFSIGWVQQNLLTTTKTLNRILKISLGGVQNELFNTGTIDPVLRELMTIMEWSCLLGVSGVVNLCKHYVASVTTEFIYHPLPQPTDHITTSKTGVKRKREVEGAWKKFRRSQIMRKTELLSSSGTITITPVVTKFVPPPESREENLVQTCDPTPSTSYTEKSSVLQPVSVQLNDIVVEPLENQAEPSMKTQSGLPSNNEKWIDELLEEIFNAETNPGTSDVNTEFNNILDLLEQ